MVISVAIIGSGVAAASTCYYLKKQNPNIHIEVFESSSEIGGRTNSVNIGGFNAEVGAGIAFTVNM